MSRYRKIDIRVYADARFRELSAPAPNGQSLWLYLLTCPFSTSVPGVLVAGEAALAEALGWPLEGFREAFREVCQMGLAKADWKARMVWLPNAIKYNPPESPNVIIGWRKHWDEVPECGLKNDAISRIEQHIKGMSEGYRKAFRDAFPEAFAEPSPNQEQEQEQEQEYPPTPQGGMFELKSEAPEPEPPVAADKPKRSPKQREHDVAAESPGFTRWWEDYPDDSGRKEERGKCYAKWVRDKLDSRSEFVMQSLQAWKLSRDWTKDNGQYICAPLVWLNKRRWEVQPAAAMLVVQKPLAADRPAKEVYRP